MPKHKTRSSATRRFKITGSGKISRERSNFRHILEKKSSTRKRRLGSTTDVSKNDESRVRRMLQG
jgi:large subunit ribosomal protein L35